MQHKVKDKLIAAIDKALEEGRWEGSLFFKNIRKQLQKLRDFVEQGLADHQTQSDTENSLSLTDVERKREGLQVVYIALYQAEGEFLQKWVQPIRALTGHSVSRPVYQSEEHVAEMIRAKRSKNDAYVAVWIKPEDIMHRQNTNAQDRLGHPVLTLKDGGVRLENIIEFVYAGSRYRFHENQLVEKK